MDGVAKTVKHETISQLKYENNFENGEEKKKGVGEGLHHRF